MPSMILRDIQPRLQTAAEQFPAVTLTGPRQGGKSTLCRSVFTAHAHVNLEAPDVRAFATEDPRGFLDQFPDGAILDEVQRCPDLPSYLQGIIDDDPQPGKWILTGSQNLILLESVSQSLAGRTAMLNLLPLTYGEIMRFREYPTTLDDALLTGGYPRIYDRALSPSDWLGSYIATYIERDVRTIANIGDLATFQRFLQLCAGRTAQMLNLVSLATDCGITQPTAKSWLSILETSFIVQRLMPWSGNIRKRLVKTPKLHFLDTGLLCWLLGIRTLEQLRVHPLRGAIFETWVVSEILKHRTNRGEHAGLFFFRDRHGLEADALVDEPNRRVTVEAKSGQTVTSDMIAASRRLAETLEEAGPVDQVVVYGGEARQPRTNLRVLPWKELHTIEW